MQLMTTAGLTDGYGIEISALEEHILRVLRHAALQTTEHTGDTHCLVAVGNHQIVVIHLALYAVQSNEFLALAGVAYVDIVVLYLIGIEGVQGLTALVEHEIGHIDDVIDRTQTDSEQAILEPFRRLLDLHALDAHARIARTGIRCLYGHLDRQV